MENKQRIWSKKILKVVEFYNLNPNMILFGITGDLDNLGIFVSQHGRSLAENLVDVYNRLIGAFMHKFVDGNSASILSFCMIPSGEEIFALGVSSNESVVNEFFSLLKSEINDFIKNNSPIQCTDVTASFGCKIFTDEKIKTLASQFSKSVVDGQTEKASRAYLELMLLMRSELSREIDLSKFHSLNVLDLDLAIFFRNIVYARLQDYKRGTKKELISIAERLSNDIELLESIRATSLNSKYGVAEEDIKLLCDLLK